jgi:hypothetical protein
LRVRDGDGPIGAVGTPEAGRTDVHLGGELSGGAQTRNELQAGPLRRQPKPRSRRRLSTDVIGALASAAERQRSALPADSPRRRPTLPTLRFMLREDDIEAAPARERR